MELGLNKYQALVYLALLEVGEADAHRLSKLSGVPRTRIYQTCQGLQDAGLVDVTTERPIQYRARAIDAYLKRMAQTHLAQAQRIESQTREIAEDFRPNVHPATPQREPRFVTTKGLAGAQESILETLARAREWATISSPPPVLELLTSHLRANPLPPGVRVQILTTLTPSNAKAARDLPPSVELRHGHEPYPAACVVVDGREGVQARFHEHSGSDLSIALWTDNTDLVEHWARTHEDGWRLALPVETNAKGSLTSGLSREFIVVKGHAQARELGRTADIPAGTPVDIWVPELDRDYFSREFPSIRKCRVRIVTPVTSKSLHVALDLAQWADVRHAPFDLEVGLSVREAGMSITTYAGSPAVDRVEQAVAAMDPKLCRTFKALFDLLWENSTPLEERVRELNADPDETRLVAPAPTRPLPEAWPRRDEKH